MTKKRVFGFIIFLVAVIAFMVIPIDLIRKIIEKKRENK